MGVGTMRNLTPRNGHGLAQPGTARHGTSSPVRPLPCVGATWGEAEQCLQASGVCSQQRSSVKCFVLLLSTKLPFPQQPPVSTARSQAKLSDDPRSAALGLIYEPAPDL